MPVHVGQGLLHCSIYLTREEGTETQEAVDDELVRDSSIYLTREEGTETSCATGWRCRR